MSMQKVIDMISKIQKVKFFQQKGKEYEDEVAYNPCRFSLNDIRNYLSTHCFGQDQRIMA